VVLDKFTKYLGVIVSLGEPERWIKRNHTEDTGRCVKSGLLAAGLELMRRGIALNYVFSFPHLLSVPLTCCT
jgi:hypothetical protein